MALIQYTSYEFRAPYPESFIRPVSPFKKHPVGSIGGVLGIPIFAIAAALEGYEISASIGALGAFLFIPGFISGSFFSVISYSYYYYKCIKYDKNLEKKIRESKNIRKNEPVQSSGEDILSQIKELSKLHDKGVLTNDEFKDKKQELLSRL